MISPTLFRFVWMYICLIKKIVLQTKLISRRHHLLQQAMKFAFIKKYLLWKSQFVVFLAGVVTFDVCQHKSFAHAQKPYKLIFGVILIWWTSLRKILLPFSKYLVYCFLCILVFKKLLLSFIIRVIFILLQWARNLSSPMKIPH